MANIIIKYLNFVFYLSTSLLCCFWLTITLKSDMLKVISELEKTNHKENNDMVGRLQRHQWKQREGGRRETSFSLFRSMISLNGLHDLKSIGRLYTRNVNRSKYNIRSKIDRAMATCDWLDRYPSAHVRLLPWIGSDHRPLLVSTDHIKYNKRSLFRYDNRWG